MYFSIGSRGREGSAHWHPWPDGLSSGMKIMSFNRLGECSRNIGRRTTLVRMNSIRVSSHQPHEVDWVSGCSILVRREAIEQVGMIDARFFYYWEETEWCFRTGRAGWKIMNVPAAKIWHKGVQRDYKPKPAVTYYDTRNHLFLLLKHHAPASAWTYNWFQIIRTYVSWTVKPKWRHKVGTPESNVARNT